MIYDLSTMNITYCFSTAEGLIASGICEDEWQEIVLERIEKDLELNVSKMFYFIL